jgi:protease-4
MEVLANSMWNDIVDDVAASRNLDVDQLKSYAANLEINTPEDALLRGMVDRIAYEDELFDRFGEYGVKRNDYGLYNSIGLRDYVTYINISPKRVSIGDKSAIEDMNKPLVAIIYAEGQIMDGNMYADGYVFGSRLAEELRQARLDNKTKAVVVRVNSPGGSALASEVAWREMTLLQQTKPVVISMGDMAASGGYYISAPADYIFADKLTLTGSIGVFGVIYNIEDTLKNKLGLTTDTAATSPSAGDITILRSLTEEQRESIMVGVDRVYSTFTSHVSEGRNLPLEDVLNIAEGRVWSGSNAVEIGLVDDIGGFTEAVAKATELAGISNKYALYEFNAPLTPFEQWLMDMGATATVNIGISRNSTYFEEIHNFLMENPLLLTNGGIQTIVPGEMQFEF